MPYNTIYAKLEVVSDLQTVVAQVDEVADHTLLVELRNRGDPVVNDRDCVNNAGKPPNLGNHCGGLE